MNDNFYGYMLRAGAAMGNTMSYDDCKQLSAFMTRKPGTCRKPCILCEE